MSTVSKIINNTRFLFTSAVVLLYFVIGVLFLFTNVWSDLLPQARAAIGSILILFGALRFYIAYRRYGTKKIKITQKAQKNETKNNK